MCPTFHCNPTVLFTFNCFSKYSGINVKLIYSFCTVTSTKEIKIILRLFLFIAMYCQASSSQFNQSLNLPVVAGWEGSLGTCSR